MDKNKKNASADATPTTPPPVADQATESAPNLSVNDLKQMAIIIDMSFKRGAFDAREAAPISQLFAKLTAFLEQFEKSADGKAPDAPAGDK